MNVLKVSVPVSELNDQLEHDENQVQILIERITSVKNCPISTPEQKEYAISMLNLDLMCFQDECRLIQKLLAGAQDDFVSVDSDIAIFFDWV